MRPRKLHKQIVKAQNSLLRVIINRKDIDFDLSNSTEEDLRLTKMFLGNLSNLCKEGVDKIQEVIDQIDKVEGS